SNEEPSSSRMSPPETASRRSHRRGSNPRVGQCSHEPKRTTLIPDSASDTGQRPTRDHARISALDAARGLAVLGMIAVNVGPRGGFSLVVTLYRIPSGRASLLFVLLGGVGFTLLPRQAWQQRKATPWRMVLWRGGLLLVMGLLLQELEHGVSVILTTYAALFF